MSILVSKLRQSTAAAVLALTTAAFAGDALAKDREFLRGLCVEAARRHGGWGVLARAAVALRQYGPCTGLASRVPFAYDLGSICHWGGLAYDRPHAGRPRYNGL